MNTTYAIQSGIEIALSIFFIWGLFHEKTLAVLEKKLLRKLFGVRRTEIIEFEKQS